MSKKRTANPEADAACLLTYLPATSPTPLQVSTPQTPLTGIVNTAAINEGTGQVYCNQVLIAVPVGTDPNNLFAPSPTPGASCNTSKWAISSMVMKSGRDLGLDNDIQYATFTFDCRAQSDFLINYNLVFGVQGQMTAITSDCTILIQENSGITNDPNTFTPKKTSYTLTAYAPQFYLNNFVATAPAAPTVPATQFANGADIQFSWESNGSYFQLYQKNVATPIYSGMQTTFKLSGGVATDTTFFLVAMMSGNPSGDSPSNGYQPIYLYDALTITITNPDLTPRSAAISANASVGGTLGVTGQTTLGSASVGGTLGVTGQATLGNANVGGTLGVTGQTNLGNATVGGTLTANGQSNLKSTSVGGSLNVSALATLSGGLTATAGPVAMATGARSINPGSYVANTDGLVVGFVSWPSDPKQLCVCWITGSTPGIWAVATGGNQGAFDNGFNKWTTSNGNSFVFPVSKGNTWSVGVQQMQQNQVAAPTGFYWIPLGTAPSGISFEWISDEQPKIDVGATLKKPVSKENQVKALVEVIEEILTRPIERHTKKKLLKALMDLQVEEYETESFPSS